MSVEKVEKKVERTTEALEQESKEYYRKVCAALQPVINSYGWYSVLYALADMANEEFLGRAELPMPAVATYFKEISNGIGKIADEWATEDM